MPVDQAPPDSAIRVIPKEYQVIKNSAKVVEMTV